MPDDIVAELDEWLRLWADQGYYDWQPMIQRARDEVVKLRNALHGAELAFVTVCAEREEMAMPVIDTRCVVVAPSPVCPWCKAPMLAVRSGGVMMWMCDAVSDHPSA